MVERIQLKSQDGNVFENGIKCHEFWKKRGLWFFLSSYRLLLCAYTLKVKEENSCSHLRLEHSQPRRHPALFCPLQTCMEYLKGFLLFLSCDFLRNDTWIFSSAQGRAAYFPGAPCICRGWPAGRSRSLSCLPRKDAQPSREIRSLLRVQTSLLPAGLSGFLAFSSVTS